MVIQTQTKKKYHYKIGVATVLMVSAFSIILMAVSPLLDIMFLQMSQMQMFDSDFIMTAAPAKKLSTIDLNRNPYMQDPFEMEDEMSSKSSEREAPVTDPEKSLTADSFGVMLMNTANIRE